MIKKMLTIVFLLLLIVLGGSIAYASDTEFYSPKEDNYVTTKNIILLSGKTKAGSEVVVDVYSKKDFDVNFEFDSTSKGKENKGEYTLVSTYNFEVGKSGLFAHELKLRKGQSKLVISIKQSDGANILVTKNIIIIEEEEDAKILLEKLKEGMSLSEAFKHMAKSTQESDISE